MNGRNGKIDLWRFIFAIVIMLHHLGMRTGLFDIAGLHFQVINAGGYAVVFYFLTSGWLMAKSAEKNSDVKSLALVAKQTAGYLWKRYKFFLVWFIPAFLLNYIRDLLDNGVVEACKHAFYNIPNLLMLQRLGFGNPEVYSNGFYVPASWYLSALLICSLIVYPLMLWNYEFFVKILAPGVSLLGLFMLLNKYGSLRAPQGIWYPITMICMGCMAHELSKVIMQNEKLRHGRKLLGFFEVGVYLLVILYICSDLPFAFEYPLSLLLAIAVAITFSGITYRKVFDNPAFSFLGRASFPLYMLHEAIADIYKKGLDKIGIDFNTMMPHLILYAICIVIALLAEFAYERIKQTRKQSFV